MRLPVAVARVLSTLPRRRGPRSGTVRRERHDGAGAAEGAVGAPLAPPPRGGVADCGTPAIAGHAVSAVPSVALRAPSASRSSGMSGSADWGSGTHGPPPGR